MLLQRMEPVHSCASQQTSYAVSAKKVNQRVASQVSLCYSHCMMREIFSYAVLRGFEDAVLPGTTLQPTGIGPRVVTHSFIASMLTV